MLIKRESVRDIVTPIRWNEGEFLKIRAEAIKRGLSFAAAVRELALEQALAELAANTRKNALDQAA